MKKKSRQQRILRVISEKRVPTQQALAEALAERGVTTTQSSISRDLDELGIVKHDGCYIVPKLLVRSAGPLLEIDSAGDHTIVVKTEVGQAQPAAVTIDRARFAEIVGTVAGDDTIFVAVKNSAAQRLAIKKIVRLFTPRLLRAVRGSASQRTGRTSSRHRATVTTTPVRLRRGSSA